MKKSSRRQSFTVAAERRHVARGARRFASVGLLSGLAIAGAAHASLTSPYSAGPGGTLTNVSGTVSVTSQYGNSSQSLGGQTSANATVNASGFATVPIKYSDQTEQIPWTSQLQSAVDSAGNISLTTKSTGYSAGINAPALAPVGSFVEQASWRATLVNTTGKTALFGVDLYSYYNDAVGYAAGYFYGQPATPGFSVVATASFGDQHYDVSKYYTSFAIDGVLLKPGESAIVGLDYKISSNYPYPLNDLSLQGNFIESVSTPVAAVPEPSTNALMALGLVAMVFVAKRRKA